MSLRDWRPRRIVGLCLLWIVGHVAISVVRAVLWLRQQPDPTRDDYVVVHAPGGAWTLVGPPLVLLAAWWWARRSARAPRDTGTDV